MRATRLPITGPCPVDLEREGADGAVRFCEHCDKDVQVLSSMTRAEAGDFLRAHAGERMCLSYQVDRGGRIVFRDDCAPAPAARGGNLVPLSRLARGSGASARTMSFVPRAAAGLALGTLAAGCTPHGEPGEGPEVLEVAEPARLGVITSEPVIPDRPERLEPEYAVDGEMEIPAIEALGDVAIPDPEVEEPCESKKPEPTPRPKTKKRGKIMLPRD